MKKNAFVKKRLTGVATAALMVFALFGAFASPQAVLESHAAGSVAIDEAHFPDATFRAYVSAQYDTDHDGTLSEEEAAKAEAVIQSDKGISSLKGIEYFPNLKYLNATKNSLTTLDLSANTKIQDVYLDYNQLTSLNLTGCTKIQRLHCWTNQLTSLDVSAMPDLVLLNCGVNKLTSLDVTCNPKLERLVCYNNSISSLDVTKNPALVQISASANKLTSLDVSRNPALRELAVDSNPITSINVSSNPALQKLFCGESSISSIDVSKNPELVELSCIHAKIRSLDLSNNPKLLVLSCADCELSKLDLSANPKIQKFFCYGNHLTSLDLSANTAMADGQQSTADGYFLSGSKIDRQTASVQAPKKGGVYTVDLASALGIDASRITSVSGLPQGAKYENGKLTFQTLPESGMAINYDYDTHSRGNTKMNVNLTVIPGEEEEDTPSEDPTKPAASGHTNGRAARSEGPRTGDTQDAALWAALLGASAAALLLTGKRRADR